jgi:hypothetical protein
MAVKLKEVAITYNLGFNKQIDSKQLFYGYSEIYGTHIYISYNTIIAVKTNLQWYVTDEWFSRTTTNHKREVSKMENCIVTVSKEFFDSTLQGLRVNKLIR